MNLKEQFTLLSLNGLDVNNLSKLKKTCLRAIFACQVYIDEKKWLDKKEIDKKLSDYKAFEKEISRNLLDQGLLSKKNSIYSLDYVFNEATEDIIVYESLETSYDQVLDQVKESLLDKEVYEEEDIFLTWLLQQTDLITTIFSEYERNQIDYRIEEALSDSPRLYKSFKKNLVDPKVKKFNRFILNRDKFNSSSYGQGLSYIMPVVHRKRAIFIRTENRFVRKDERLKDLFSKLDERDIPYRLVRDGQIPIVKINNKYYELVPYVINMYRYATYGSQLREINFR